MKLNLKKYVLALMLPFLCASALFLKPVILKAQDNSNTSPATPAAGAQTPGTTVTAPAAQTGGTQTTSGTGNGSYTLLEPLPCIPSEAKTDSTGKVISTAVTCPNGNGNTVSSVNFQQYLQFFFNLVIALSAAAAVFMIAAGGLQYMTTDAWTVKEAGKKRVQDAVIGLIVVLCSFFLLQIIDPRLVAIPTTLVPPLNIKYSSQTSNFMTGLVSQADSLDQIAQQTNTLVAQADKIRSDVNAADNLISVDKTKITDFQNQIANAMVQDGYYTNTDPNDISPDQITAACDDDTPTGNDDLDNKLNDLCPKITRTTQEINQTQANMTAEIAQGDVYYQVEQCMGIGSKNGTGSSNTSSTQYGAQTMSQCLSNMTKTAGTYAQQLYASGQPVLASQVQDQGVYAETIAKINNAVVSNMTKNPQDQAVMQTACTTMLAGGTIIGAATGGVAGAAGGFAVGSLLSGGLKGADAIVQAKQAQTAVDQINTVVNSELANIKDQSLRTQLINQAGVITKSLGGQLKINSSQ